MIKYKVGDLVKTAENKMKRIYGEKWEDDDASYEEDNMVIGLHGDEAVMGTPEEIENTIKVCRRVLLRHKKTFNKIKNAKFGDCKPSKSEASRTKIMKNENSKVK